MEDNLEYKSSDLSKESIREFYKDHSDEEIYNESMKALVNALPPDQYGEDDNCEALQDLIGEQQFRIEDLRDLNRQLTAALELANGHTILLNQYIEKLKSK